MQPILELKDPSAITPFGFDWTAYLGGLGSNVLIGTSTWTRSGPDTSLTITNPSIVTGAKQTQLMLSGGTRGARYTVTNRIVTDSSPAVTDERSFDVLVEDA